MTRVALNLVSGGQRCPSETRLESTRKISNAENFWSMSCNQGSTGLERRLTIFDSAPHELSVCLDFGSLLLL